MASHGYLIALGSNVPHHRHGTPRRILRAAIEALKQENFQVEAAAPMIETAPLGHSRRRYANGAVLVHSALPPDQVLQVLKRIESAFGRRSAGLPWSARVLDLDIVLWSGGPWAREDLVIPHPAFRQRRFVLTPAARVAASWRDPLTGLTVKQLQTRLTKPRPAAE